MLDGGILGKWKACCSPTNTYSDWWENEDNIHWLVWLTHLHVLTNRSLSSAIPDCQWLGAWSCQCYFFKVTTRNKFGSVVWECVKCKRCSRLYLSFLSFCWCRFPASKSTYTSLGTSWLATLYALLNVLLELDTNTRFGSFDKSITCSKEFYTPPLEEIISFWRRLSLSDRICQTNQMHQRKRESLSPSFSL